MKTQTLSTSELFIRAKKLAALERRIGVEILECLREIERRKAYSDLGYDGLYTYCIKELGFTDSQAYQRIQAMRAVTETPELKSRIESGALTVSAVSKVQTHLRQEKKMGVRREASQKLALFTAVENITSREVDSKLAEEKGEKLRTKLVLELDEELEALWEQVKDLSAHRACGEPVEILRMLTREWLKKNDPGRKGIQTNQVQTKKTQEKIAHEVRTKFVLGSGPQTSSAVNSYTGPTPKSEPEFQRTVPLSTWVPDEEKRANRSLFPETRRITPKSHPGPRPAIPVALRRQVWLRDHGRCSRCLSRYALELDHRTAVALGGETILENLRLLCRSCNQRAAIRAFGLRKIERERLRRS